jgi:bifunctional aspartokinase / homoserine dehydrogenase 1
VSAVAAGPERLPERLPDRRVVRRGSLVVYKFGGAALADAESVRHAVSLVARRTPGTTVVVVSAIAGVTDALLALAQAAPSAGVERLRPDIERLEAKHVRVAEAALADAPAHERADVVAAIRDAFDELARIVAAVWELGELRTRDVDRIVARGERLSARVLAAALSTAGVPARFVDATRIIETDGRHGAATPNVERTTAASRRALGPLLASGIVPVVRSSDADRRCSRRCSATIAVRRRARRS